MRKMKALQNRIRGWFPSTPTLPQPKQRIPKTQNLRLQQPSLPPPPPPSPETRFQRNGGIVIGLGIALLFVGSMGAVISRLTYLEVAKVLSYLEVGADHYLLRDLTSQLSIYLSIVTMGAIVILWGWLLLRSTLARQRALYKGPSLSGGLVGGGGLFQQFPLA